MKKICKLCGTEVEKETDMELKEDYPYYCPYCDENKYSFECENLPENEDERKRKIIHYLATEDYLPINAWWIRSEEGMLDALKALLKEGIIRMRNCEASAVELNTTDR